MGPAGILYFGVYFPVKKFDIKGFNTTTGVELSEGFLLALSFAYLNKTRFEFHMLQHFV